MRRISCIQDARQLLEHSHGFRDSLKASVQPVLYLLQEQFSRLKLKGQPIEVAMVADEDVTDFFQSLRIIDEAIEQNKVTQKDMKRCERLADFMTRHCHQRQYIMFQVKKCALDEINDCWYCVFNPPQLPEETYRDLHFVPDPMQEHK